VSPEQWKEVRDVFDEALSIDTATRAQWLRERCGSDPQVLNEVQLLLTADRRLRETATLTAKSVPAASLAGTFKGLRVGPYELLDAAGQGGMGFVYKAGRVDAAFDKTVAIKLIGVPDLDSDLENAFRHERRILAALDHPNICRLLDAGTTPEGLLYVVMEFVDGQPIDAYCRARALHTEAILTLFAGVCSAVEYAHRRLIVHCDLKPGNILVTPDGEVKLLDFGISRMVSDSRGLTDILSARMTPRYASPEQIAGELITTASDIYSLGVVLQEVVTQNGSRTPDADLDSILSMALRKDPERRYGSVEQFAADLRRYQEKRPVLAREPTLWYRLGKLVQRRPDALAAGALIVLTVITAIGITLWQTRMALEQGRQAQALLRQLHESGAALPIQPPDPVSVFRPQALLFQYVALTLFGSAIWLSRATLTRVLGALVGGVVCVLLWLVRFRVDYALGWTRRASPDALALSELMPLPLLLAVGICFAATLLLVLWRVARRFGWKMQAAATIALAAYCVFREHIWTERLLELSVGASGLMPFVADTGVWILALALAQCIMRLIAGPAGADRLTRTSGAGLRLSQLK